MVIASAMSLKTCKFTDEVLELSWKSLNRRHPWRIWWYHGDDSVVVVVRVRSLVTRAKVLGIVCTAMVIGVEVCGRKRTFRSWDNGSDRALYL